MSTWLTALKQLMPRGGLWNFAPDSNISRTLQAIADSWDRVDSRAADLIEETDPRTATETLSDWEAMVGLPDEAIVEIPTGAPARRFAITQKVTRRNGQTPQFFIDLSAACGYTVTINDGYWANVSYCGLAQCGITPLGDEEWAFTWTVIVSAVDPSALSTAEFEAIIRRSAPAHTTVYFTYP